MELAFPGKLFGGTYVRRARNRHTCWCCGRVIERGEPYFRTAGWYVRGVFSVKHCRPKCETAADMLDQNHDHALWLRVYELTRG